MAVGGNTAYAGITDLPPLVQAAIELAESQGFDNSCDPAQGRLLSLLAGGSVGGRIGETGTGCGVGLDPTDGWLAVGGTIVLDDFVPYDRPDASAHDHARRYWLGHPALQATELRLSPTLATLVGVRVR